MTIVPSDRDFDDHDFDGEERFCWRCDGEGGGMVGVDWESDDPINGPYGGEIEQCDCCGGTGKAADCVYW